MSLIKQLIQNNFPDQLVIPVAPPGAAFKEKFINEDGDESAKVGTSDGKHPAVLYSEGLWGPCKWLDGKVDRQARDKADAAGCNAGLVLGLPSAEWKGYCFVAVDIDLDECGDSRDQTAFCDLLERELSAAYSKVSHPGQKVRYVCWIRKTSTFRATILCRVPIESFPGKKKKVTYHEIEQDGKPRFNPFTTHKIRHGIEIIT